jgi:hypothetical protein
MKLTFMNFIRARKSGMKKAKRDLAQIQAHFEKNTSQELQ